MTPRVDLVALDRQTMLALADGDLAGAQRTSPIPLTSFFASDDQRAVWRRRAQQIAADPGEAHWVTRVVWDPLLRCAVGRAGFHGRPDARGMVEVGYEIDPHYRRRGYARAALTELVEWASLEPEVKVVRASVSPDNGPSLSLILSFGFVQVGEQWDDEDGRELVHEMSLRQGTMTA